MGTRSTATMDDSAVSAPIADLEERRAILRAFLASSGENYRRPFESGRFAAFSIIGTEDWQDYASTVLQVVQADTMLAIEDKLDRLIELLAEGSPQQAHDPQTTPKPVEPSSR